MRVIRTIIVLAIASVLGAGIARAQATRTWVSGVGDDANPCSRTAPCKTFAGAISKTAAGGEIDALDPGGFGAVTITKSITIDGFGAGASILASLVNGIIINAGPNDVVTIRRLSINGAGGGLNGIKFLQGGMVHVEDCIIFGFNGNGIDAVPTNMGAELFVRRSQLRENDGGAISLAPSFPMVATIDGVTMDRNLFGVRAASRTIVTVSNSVASRNLNSGFIAVSTSGQFADLTLENCVSAHNVASGVHSETSGGSATVRISNVTAVLNTTGLNAAGGAIVSFGNNRIEGNGMNGAPTMTVSLQ